MGIQIIPQQGSVFGRIGKGIGEGLANQFPKELDRLRLSSGLKNLENSKETSPLGQLAETYAIPGITPEIANQALEYRRQQALIQEAQNQRNPNGSQPAVQGMAQQSQQTQNAAPMQQQRMPNNQQQPIQQQQPQEQPPLRRLNTPEALTQRATELIQQSPLRYRTLEHGIAAAQKEYDTQESNIQKIDNRFDNDLKGKLHTGQTYGQVLGELQDTFKQKAYDDVLSGKSTVEQAAKKYSDQALSFAKARQNLNTVGSISRWATKPSVNRQNIDNIREEYKKVGQLEAFSNELVGQGLSQPYAHYLAYPPKSNKEIAKIISSTPGRHGSAYNRAKQAFTGDQERKMADRITEGNHLTNDDSLLAIALQLQENRMDPNVFLQQIDRNRREGKLRLNDRQRAELQKVGNFRPTLGDTYLFALSGLDPLMEGK